MKTSDRLILDALTVLWCLCKRTKQFLSKIKQNSTSDLKDSSTDI